VVPYLWPRLAHADRASVVNHTIGVDLGQYVTRVTRKPESLLFAQRASRLLINEIRCSDVRPCESEGLASVSRAFAVRRDSPESDTECRLAAVTVKRKLGAGDRVAGKKRNRNQHTFGAVLVLTILVSDRGLE